MQSGQWLKMSQFGFAEAGGRQAPESTLRHNLSTAGGLPARDS